MAPHRDPVPGHLTKLTCRERPFRLRIALPHPEVLCQSGKERLDPLWREPPELVYQQSKRGSLVRHRDKPDPPLRAPDRDPDTGAPGRSDHGANPVPPQDPAEPEKVRDDEHRRREREPLEHGIGVTVEIAVAVIEGDGGERFSRVGTRFTCQELVQRHDRVTCREVAHLALEAVDPHVQAVKIQHWVERTAVDAVIVQYQDLPTVEPRGDPCQAGENAEPVQHLFQDPHRGYSRAFTAVRVTWSSSMPPTREQTNRSPNVGCRSRNHCTAQAHARHGHGQHSSCMRYLSRTRTTWNRALV